MTTKSVTLHAADPKAGVTLGELAQFCQEAMRLDLPPDTPVRVVMGWGAQIQRIGTGVRRP